MYIHVKTHGLLHIIIGLLSSTWLHFCVWYQLDDSSEESGVENEEEEEEEGKEEEEEGGEGRKSRKPKLYVPPRIHAMPFGE